MNREEILAKSRAEKQDEGVIYAGNKGRNYGVRALCAIFVVIAMVNAWNDQSNHEVFAMFWMYSGFECIGKYKANGEIGWLIAGVLGAIAAIVFFVAHILEII